MKIKSILFALVTVCALLLSGCTETGTPGLTTAGGTTTPAETGESDTDVSTSAIDGVIEDTSGNSSAEGESSAETEPETQTMSDKALSAKLIGWGLGSERDSRNRPFDALNAQLKYGAFDAVFINPYAEKRLYLTFDEGYENGYTSEILDILKEKGVKAAFFVTYDYCKSAPDLVKRMIDEGHTVGNHSYTHTSFPTCSEREVREEITYLHDYVENEFGYKMTLIRFPKGEFSEKTLAVSQEYGYTTVFWSFAHVDWDTKNQPTAKEAFDKITLATHSGAIYLLHAVSKANTDCLSDVIDYWKNTGFTVGNPEELSDI